MSVHVTSTNTKNTLLRCCKIHRYDHRSSSPCGRPHMKTLCSMLVRSINLPRVYETIMNISLDLEPSLHPISNNMTVLIITFISHASMSTKSHIPNVTKIPIDALFQSEHLHSGLLTSWAEIVPKVEEKASHVITPEAIESDLRISCLQSNAKHHRNDKSTIASNS